MVAPYKEDGSGTIWLPTEAYENEKVKEEIRERYNEGLKQENREEPLLGTHDTGSFQLEEMYVDHETLEINGLIENHFVGLSIPLKNNDRLQKIVEDLNKIVTIDKDSSGLYLKPKDFSEVRTKTADGQGRINLGKEYSGEDVRVVILEE